jgi:phosphoserine phosphatase
VVGESDAGTPNLIARRRSVKSAAIEGRDEVAWVMTLIGGEGAKNALPDTAAATVRALGIRGEPDWLAPGTACDLPLGEAAEAAARAAIGDAAIDVVVQPVAHRRKRLLVADLESTVIENEMLDELADFVGMRKQVAAITRRAMNGELDFAAALAERVALLEGLPVSVLDDAATHIRVMPGARALVATSRAAGMRTALVSGGFTVFADRVGASLGFDRVVANRLDIVDGRIAGTVRTPIVDREAKRAALVTLAAAEGIPLAATLAVGDGANDLPMLLAAGLGVAFRAKPAVAAAARWRIDHADLTALLYAQGYRAEEIASG